jgi:hypothetical protein
MVRRSINNSAAARRMTYFYLRQRELAKEQKGPQLGKDRLTFAPSLAKIS